MLHRFIHLYSAIKSSIEISKDIKNKKSISFSENEIDFLQDCHSIFQIFVKALSVLQEQKYCTIQYIYSYIYQIQIRLREKLRQVSETLIDRMRFTI